MVYILTPVNPLAPPPFLSRPKPPPTHLSSLDLSADPWELRQFLSLAAKRGLAGEGALQAKLVALLSRSGQLREASLVFASITHKTDEVYHSMLKAHARHSPLDEALAFFCAMRAASVRPAVYSFTYLLKSCGATSDLRRGREIHAQLVTHGHGSNVFAMTAVLNMYAKCRRVDEARKLFDRMPDRDSVACNAVVAGYAQNGLPEAALEMVRRMQEDGQTPDSITLVSALPACANLGSLRLGRFVHGYSLRAGFECLVNISTALVDMYSKCGAVGKAFDWCSTG